MRNQNFFIEWEGKDILSLKKLEQAKFWNHCSNYFKNHSDYNSWEVQFMLIDMNVKCLHRMLFQYLDHKRKESSPQLHATYLVSGKFEDNGQTVSYDTGHLFFPNAQKPSFNILCLLLFAFQCHKVSVIREDQLEGAEIWFPGALSGTHSCVTLVFWFLFWVSMTQLICKEVFLCRTASNKNPCCFSLLPLVHQRSCSL